jgi:murein DD-endopeptidase MepM/ murein hydrolase activator NlpD
MRRGVWLFVLAVLGAALGVASAYADGTTTTTGTTTPAPSYAQLPGSRLTKSCVGAGVAVIVEPGGRPLAFGTPASDLGPSAYPVAQPWIAIDSSAASGSTCKSAAVTLESLSLFGGAVTATSVEATHGRGRVTGLQIDGADVAATGGQSVQIGNWGRLTLGARLGRLWGPFVLRLLRTHDSLPAGTSILVAFAAARLQAKPAHRSGGTSTQTTQTTTNGAVTGQARTKKHGHGKHVAQPLKRTPPLGFRPSHYVFPVDAGASYIDTYGANRSDIYDGWHHGDDLFAPLGTPVVAVANGTLTLVGWEQLGGWRLWLTDGDGNSFYYAHLAAYSRWILTHHRVRAGEVVGFLGRTGDAFSTTPHLHFEIHPHQYLKLGYDGAVDPTAYLKKWRVVKVPAKEMPNPAKLKAPVGTPAEEAAVVWHELLAARHLLSARTKVVSDTPRRPFPEPSPLGMRGLEAAGVPLRIGDRRRTSADVDAASAGTAPWLAGGGAGGVLLVLSAGAFTLFRRRRNAAETST